VLKGSISSWISTLVLLLLIVFECIKALKTELRRTSLKGKEVLMTKVDNCKIFRDLK
jgi:hypothetical protein